MKGQLSVQFCDAEEGCVEWMPDHHAMEVSNWRELLGRWTFDPKKDYALCPYHHPDAVAEREAGYPTFYEMLGMDPAPEFLKRHARLFTPRE